MRRLAAVFVMLILPMLCLGGCSGGASSSVLPGVQDQAVVSSGTTATATATPTPAPVPTTGTLAVQATFVPVAKTASAANGLDAATATLVVHLVDSTGHDVSGLPTTVSHTPGDTATLSLGTITAPGGAYTLYAVLVGAGGNLLGLAQQPVSVTNGQTVTATLSSSQAVTALALTPGVGSVTVGGTQAFTATATLADSSTVNATPLATWSSSATSIATVSSATATIGVVAGVAAGTATITAGMASLTGTALLTVGATSISVTPQTKTIGTRGSQQMTATLSFTGGTTQDVTSVVAWRSSDTTIATVGVTGMVAAQGKAGTATVTATLGGVSGQAAITAAIGIDFTLRQAELGFRAASYGNGFFVACQDSSAYTSPDGATWTQRSLPTSGGLFAGAAYFDGTRHFLMGSDKGGGVIWSSVDGVTWTRSAVGGTEVAGMVRNGSTLVAVGIASPGASFISTDDGANWTMHAVAVSNLGGVAYGNGVYVATVPQRINSVSTAFTSSDGITWNAVNTGTNASSVAFGNGRFVVVGLGGIDKAGTSTDGTSWTPVTNTGTGTPNCVRFLNDRFVVASSNGLFTSTDGTAYTGMTFSVSSTRKDLYGVAFGGGTYVGVGSIVARSTDGTTLNQLAGWGMPPNLNGQGFPVDPFVTAFGKGVFVSANKAQVEVTSDLATFTVTKNLTGGGRATAIAFANDEFRLVTKGTATMKSLVINGDNTVTATSAAAGSSLNGIAFGNATWVAVGDSGVIVTTPGGSLSMTPQTSNTGEKLSDVAFANGQFVACGDNGTLLTSPDGVTWTPRTSPATDNLLRVAFGNGHWIAVSSTAIVTSTDGIAWTALASPTTDTLDTVSFCNGSFYLGSTYREYSSSDGAAWSSLETIFLGAYQSVAFGNGTLVLTGNPNGGTDNQPDLVIVSSP